MGNILSSSDRVALVDVYIELRLGLGFYGQGSRVRVLELGFRVRVRVIGLGFRVRSLELGGFRIRVSVSAPL